MPYKKKADLPEAVRDTLPSHAEEIYKEAYNSAFEQYDHDEQRAHRIAWGAVKKQYHKDEDSGKWVEGPSDDAD